jgi:hypothetical protein
MMRTIEFHAVITHGMSFGEAVWLAWIGVAMLAERWRHRRKRGAR